MNQQVESEAQRAHRRLTEMAERVALNFAQPFGGVAVVIVPGAESAVEMLVIGDAEPGQFMATIGTRLKMIAEEMDIRAKQTQVFGR